MLLSAATRWKIYLQLFLLNPKDPKVLLPLASTCRLLRAEVLLFYRDNIGFAFRQPLMLRPFL